MKFIKNSSKLIGLGLIRLIGKAKKINKKIIIK